MPGESEFRRVMGHFATGVTVVASRRPDGTLCGLTANAVTSVSLQPPLVLVCLERGAHSHRCVLEGGAFAISVLADDQEEVARRFALTPRARRFEGVEYREEVTGSPVLEGALAWTDCQVHDVHDAGDHSIVIGEVVACGARSGSPLIFFRSRYSQVLS